MRVSFLPPNFFQFGGLKIGVFFQNAERVAALDGAMLRRVAGQDDPAVSLFGEISHPRQRANTHQSRFINPNDLITDLRL